ncbi:TIGR03862 family flavoprotein [Stappia stellulata]|uniref:TIGR03862 family flavoprotein n=1 Tax=Stappia stellulata TaxID=71235 RepID=UPI0004138E66|nr:TIGR03862 family flavoprotein [Stappia stellulata]
MTSSSADVAIVGGGPAGLIAADRLSARGVGVTVYERMPSVGRKFLMAGRGGLNLTHSEPADAFLSRYREAEPRLRAAIEAFPPEALRAWCEDLGIETFVGSSGRVFPRQMKASPLLRALLARLSANGVTIRTRWRWTGFGADGALSFDTPQGPKTHPAPDAVLLALGGASWARLGSDGAWSAATDAAGIARVPFSPSNCGIEVKWSQHFADRFQGVPLKRIALSVGDRTLRGEAMITASGLEGGGVYALSPDIRRALADTSAPATLTLDLRPDLDVGTLAARLARPRGKTSLSNHLRKTTGLAPAAVALLREAGERPQGAEALAARIKALPLPVTGVAGMARAISSAGGIAWSGIDDGYMLKDRTGVFVAGEMIDWEAPTGGYLLQACFATGTAAASAILTRLDHTESPP